MSRSTRDPMAGFLGRLATLVAAGVLMLACPRSGAAATFNYSSGNTACLIAAINSANSNNEADTIILAAGFSTLAVINNTTEVLT
jgi:hypothetical protein